MKRAYIPSLFLSLLLGACLVACVEEHDDFRTVSFEASEVQAELDVDPDAVFVVELRDGLLYEFVQHDAELPWDHFVVQSPSISAPIPMTSFARALDMDLDRPQWTLQSPEHGFRAGSELIECMGDCYDNGGYGEQDDIDQTCFSLCEP